MNETREKLIQNYIDGYNEFDIEKMTRDLDDNIIFQNVQNEETNLTLNGIDAFKQQALEAKSYFKSRQQKITAINHFDDNTAIEIDYVAVLAMDFPNGLKKGQQLELKGKSIFRFRDNKIIELTDIA
ncbi:MAG: nuclear transport factor 2 family protein [Flavobacterium sp.]|nr:MAG: nuclear transport factor 2 family protein [Flavobacterium sp.]